MLYVEGYPSSHPKLGVNWIKTHEMTFFSYVFCIFYHDEAMGDGCEFVHKSTNEFDTGQEKPENLAGIHRKRERKRKKRSRNYVV